MLSCLKTIPPATNTVAKLMPKLPTCSCCGASGTNKSTCPHNPSLAISSHNLVKHNQVPKPPPPKPPKPPNSTNHIFSKAHNKLREDRRIEFIVNSINDPTSALGLRMRESYAATIPGSVIAQVSTSGGGGCSAHYDFTILTEDGTTLKCEEKGTEKLTANLSPTKPWANSVQAVNITMKGLDFSDRYAKLYFEIIKELGIEYGVDLVGFELDDFLLDFYRAGSVQSTQMKAIKAAFSAKWGNVSVQRQYTTRIHAINTRFVAEVTPLEKQQFVDSVQKKITASFADKDCWLQTAGLTLSGDIYAATGAFDYAESAKTCRFMWSPKINPPIIKGVVLEAIVSGKSAQLYLSYLIEDTGNPTGVKRSVRTSIRLRNKFANCSTDYK